MHQVDPGSADAVGTAAAALGLPLEVASVGPALDGEGAAAAAALAVSFAGGEAGGGAAADGATVQRAKKPTTNPPRRDGTPLTSEQLSLAAAFAKAVLAALDKPDALSLSPTQAANAKRAVAEMLATFGESQQAVTGGAMVDDRAVQAIALAQSQIGLTDSTKSDGPDPDDPQNDPKHPPRKLRMRRDVVLQYFDGAYGGAGFNKDVVKHITPGKKWKGKVDDLGVKVQERTDDLLQDWCGIFPLWALRAAGFGLGTWKIGSTVGGVDGMRTLNFNAKMSPVDKVQHGDIGNISKHQHQYLISRVEGDTLHTIEGNTDSGAGAQGGQVSEHSSRTVSTTDVFFRPIDSIASAAKPSP